MKRIKVTSISTTGATITSGWMSEEYGKKYYQYVKETKPESVHTLIYKK